MKIVGFVGFYLNYFIAVEPSPIHLSSTNNNFPVRLQQWHQIETPPIRCTVPI